jgi:hypothetical protein
MISCFMLMCSLNGFSQDPPVNQLKLSVTRMLWAPEAGIEFSYQRKTSDRFAYHATVGRPMNIIGTRYDRLRGYTLAFEQKMFIKRTNNTGKYL